MAMNLVILAIVLASFALGFRFADIRAEALDRVQRRQAEDAMSPSVARRARTVLPARLRATPALPTAARRPAVRATASAASAPHS